MNYEAIAQYSEIIGGFAFVIVMVWLFRKFVLPAVRAGEVARNADLVNAGGYKPKEVASSPAVAQLFE